MPPNVLVPPTRKGPLHPERPFWWENQACWACHIQCASSSARVISISRSCVTRSLLSVSSMRARSRSMSAERMSTIAATVDSTDCQLSGYSGTPELSTTVFALPFGEMPMALARSATSSTYWRAVFTSSSSCRCALRKFEPTTFQCACLAMRDRSTRSTSVAWRALPVISLSASESGLLIGDLLISGDPFLVLVRTWRGGSDGGGERDLDVAAGRVGVGAHLVGLLDQLVGLGLLEARQRDVQRDTEAEAHVLLGHADLRGHRGLGQRDLGLARDQLQSAVEAGRIAGGEELLGVGLVAP